MPPNPHECNFSDILHIPYIAYTDFLDVKIVYYWVIFLVYLTMLFISYMLHYAVSRACDLDSKSSDSGGDIRMFHHHILSPVVKRPEIKPDHSPNSKG